MNRLLFLFVFLIPSLGFGRAIPGEFIVKLKSAKSLPKSLTAGIEVKKNFEALGSHFALIKSEQSLKSLEDRFQGLDVEYIEPNYEWKAIGKLEKDNVDPLYQQLWGLKNTGNNEPLRGGGTRAGVVGSDINAEKAWELTKGSNEIVVAVIDTGIDYNHEDLMANIWKNQAELDGEEGVDDDGNGKIDDIYGYDFVNNDADPIDDHGHGTHCAGTIGAVHQNQKGIAGVMANVKMMGLKFLSASGSGSTAGAIQAIDYATKMGVDIMSNSWGGGSYSKALEDAIKRAKAKGIVFVAAAGNSASNNDERPHYPSNYQVDNVISVAAHNAQEKLASFSCFGKNTVHVAAPGRNILSTVINNKYAIYSGTSMATPHVSGIVGLYLARHGNTAPITVREDLMKSSIYKKPYNRTTVARGRVDAHNFLMKLTAEKPELPDPRSWRADTSQSFESNHPYGNDENETKEFTVSGAKFIRAIFEKIDTERRFDTLTIKDSEGNTLESLSGTYSNYATEYADGDTLKITFKSDRSVTKYGFKLKEIQYILE